MRNVVLASVSIALNMFTTSVYLQAIPLFIFIFGMISVFVGIMFAALEVYRSYKIVLLEVKGDD